MVTRNVKSVIIYDPHPHVSIFREFAGYATNTIDEDITEEDNTEYLKSLDPKNWKTNDHYAVVNLKNTRYKASDDEVRKKYRKLVLKHHPDKRRGRGEDVKDESHDYFTCITQAIEILGNPSKRNAYDSVDPFVVNETNPTVNEIKKDFFGILTPVFTQWARWSKRQPVPHLGYSNTPLHLVHRFYDFWHDYETNKDFSFLDEEEKEKGEDRDTRKYIERQNRADRARRKAEEQKKVSQLVCLASEHDPRLIAAIKANKQAKEDKKQERLLFMQKKREAAEENLRLEKEKEERERAASEERRKLEIDKIRKEKEASKMVAKKEKKRLRNLCADRFDYFTTSAVAANPSAIPGDIKLETLQDMDLLCQVLSNVELFDLNDGLSNAKNQSESYEIWQKEVARVKKNSAAPGLTTEAKVNGALGGKGKTEKNASKWTFEMTQSLIKAVNIFPAGTQKRWEVISAYVNQHVKNVSITGKDALAHAKNLKNDDGSLRLETNSKAFDNFSHNIRESNATQSVTITDITEADSIRPWSTTEQRALEKALRLYPAVPGEPSMDRWQRISDSVITRTRKECMLRYKDLAEQIRLKRAALVTAGVSDKK